MDIPNPGHVEVDGSRRTFTAAMQKHAHDQKYAKQQKRDRGSKVKRGKSTRAKQKNDSTSTEKSSDNDSDSSYEAPSDEVKNKKLNHVRASVEKLQLEEQNDKSFKSESLMMMKRSN